MENFDEFIFDDGTDNNKKSINKKAITYVCFVQDHSGSMQPKSELTMNNFNEQLQALKKQVDEDMDIVVSVIEFDSKVKCTIENKNVLDIPEAREYKTGSMTALYDAIAIGIDRVKKSFNADTREDKSVLMVIQTDGAENVSSDYAGEEGRLKLKSMIKELEDSGEWTFTFLGENIDTETIQEMGMSLNNTVSYATADAVRAYGETTKSMNNFMDARKKGIKSVSDFYGTDGKLNTDKKDKKK